MQHPASFFRSLVTCVALLVPASLPAQKGAATTTPSVMLDGLISGEDPWAMTAEQFGQKFKGSRFQWLSDKHDQARFFGQYALWNGEIAVTESVVEFQGGKLFRVNFSLYSRGDARTEISTKAEFDKRLEAIRQTLTSHTAVQPIDLGKQAASAVKAIGFAWTKAPSVYLLEYSVVKEAKNTGVEFRPEFIRLRAYELPKKVGFGTPNPITAATATKRVSKKSLVENIARESTGDVFLKNVPMVDQGPKGYCAVATAERVFRYYGMPVDQHEMAQAANTGSGGGTDPEEMLKALTALQGRLHVHVRAISKWEFAEFSRMITDYNREAKRNKKPEINLAGRRVIDIAEIYGSMDPASLKDSKIQEDRGLHDPDFPVRTGSGAEAGRHAGQTLRGDRG